jgi:hypothetical protein
LVSALGLVAGTLSRSRAIMVLWPLNIVVLVAILAAALIVGYMTVPA